MWQLFGILRNGESLKHDFQPDRLTIGRATTNSIRLEDETVSSLHAEIELVGPGKYVLRDLGSKNGTFVEGVAITEVEISNPCKIAFGALTFEVRIGESESVANRQSGQGHDAEVAGLRAECEKLRCEFESERKGFSEKIAQSARENESRQMEDRKECEALGRTIEELKEAHGAQLENEQREHSRKIATIEKESKALLLEVRKNCEEQSRTIEETKAAHAAELESARREHSGKIAEIEKQSEARLIEKQKECEELGRAIEDLKAAHGAELESTRREHSGKIAEIDMQSEARLTERQKECEELRRTIAEIKAAHGAELESAAREHSGKIADIEKQSEARLTERQKECEELRRTIEDIKGTHGAELEKERKAQAEKMADIEKQSEARLLEKQKECEALSGAVAELKKAASERAEAKGIEEIAGAPGKTTEAATGSRESIHSAPEPVEASSGKRPADSSPANKWSEIKPSFAAVKQRFSRVALANRRMGQWLRMFVVAGLLGFGLMCLLAQSLPPTVLPSMNPLRMVSSDGVTAPSAAEDSKAANSGSGPERAGTDPGASRGGGDNRHEIATSNDPAETPEADRRIASRGSGAISMDPSVTRGQPLALTSRTEKTHAGENAQSPAAPKMDEPAKNAPDGQSPEPPGPTNSAERGAAKPDSGGTAPGPLKGSAVTGETKRKPEKAEKAPDNVAQRAAPAERAAHDPVAPCPNVTIEPWQDDQLHEIGEELASGTGSARPPDQNAAAAADPQRKEAATVGLKMQEEGKSSAKSVDSGSDPIVGDSDAPVAERKSADGSPSADGAGALKAGPGSHDLAKADLPSGLPNALNHKDSPGGKSLKGPQPLRVLILGDSLSLCGFGKRLDQKFREDPEVHSVYTYMACGTHPLSWIKEKPYTTVKTHCGFWSIESSDGQPKEMEDTYGMTTGHVPKGHPVPKLEDLVEKIHPDILIMQCGTNLFSLFESRTTVQAAKDSPMVRNYIVPFLNAARKCSSLRKMYWVAPPTSGRVPAEVQDFVFNETRECAGWMATVIDSRPMVSYPYHHMEPDHEHFMGTDMTQWADSTYTFIKQDLSAQPFSSLPTLAQLQPPAGIEGPKKKETAAPEEPLYVQAKLEFKSQPIPLKQLMPYQESLVSFVYDVSRVVNGKYEDKQILVLHPSYIGLKAQPLDKYKTGKTYNLRLHEVEATPWHTVRCQDESGRIDLIPYIQVEDEKKFPGTSR